MLNILYAAGVQDMEICLRTLRQEASYIIAEELQNDCSTDRTVVIEELSPAWFCDAFPDHANQVCNFFDDKGQPIESAFLNLVADVAQNSGAIGESLFLNRFGRTRLDRVEERDIDLLLLEEFTSEPALTALFARLIFDENRAREFLEISNSVSTASGGESDLIALYKEQDEVVAVLIENKIGARFMPRQANRYHKRGQAGIEDGAWNRYVTCLLAPEAYLEGDHGDHVFDHQVAYEELLPHFESRSSTARGRWRSAIIKQAIHGARTSTYVRVVDEAVSRFFRSYWKYASQHFPALRMPHERDRPATNTWVRFNPDVNLPKRISLVHKARYGTVDIQVSACRVEELHEAIGDFLTPEMHLEQTGKSAVVRVMVPEIDAFQSFEKQNEEVHQALIAADNLRELLAERREKLESL
jgi:hypothetical protein